MADCPAVHREAELVAEVEQAGVGARGKRIGEQAETEHGGHFASLVAADRIIGFQFHPERSGRHGVHMLRNTLELIAADRPSPAEVLA